jgi:para-aminobenzoate synthetase component I
LPRIAELRYHADATVYFEAVVDQPWAVFLDSGRHDPGRSRYDIVAAEPWATLVTRAGMTEIRAGDATRISPDDPFLLIRGALGPPAVSSGPLPFYGGAIGYFGYDLGRRLERMPAIATDDEQLPEMAVGLYAWAVVVDHADARAWLVGGGPSEPDAAAWDALRRRFEKLPVQRVRLPFRTHAPVRSNFTREHYASAFERVMRYIHEGDCYQVNLAQRFEVQATGDPWSAYQALRISNPAPFAAYLNLPFVQVLSASPERFLQVRSGHVVTQPIKGTRPRAGHPRLDAQRARELQNSAKDRAENVMIVDLLRNDLAKTCRIGSVKVPKLFEVQSFPSVHHLVSTIEGELASGRDALDLLRSCFPGGSITGAPKLRAMEIIEELEPCRRGIYCGSIGYIGHDGAMDTNIAIRTLVYRGGQARFWAGGGLVADSVVGEEYQETLDKAAPFLQLVQRCAEASASG